MKTYYFLLPDLSAGGAERVCITIARILRSQGFDVKFLNLGSSEGEMKGWIEPEFELISLGCKRVLTAFWDLHNFFRDKPNSVLFSSREHLSIVGIVAAKYFGLPIIVRIPNMPNNSLSRNSLGRLKEWVIKRLNYNLLPYAKTIIAQNEEMAEQLVLYYRLDNKKVVAINNPIDKEFVVNSAKNSPSPFPDNKINFLNVCNISYAKGIDILLEAFAKVKKQIPNAHLTIVGRSSSDYANNLVVQSKSDDSITFAGFQSNPYPYLKHCDVFVLPSRMEGFPNVVLEAMCFNRPIVSTTCVDVIKQIITPGVNGYYCDVGNPNTLAECMGRAYALKNIQNNYNLFNLQKLLSIFS